MAETVRYDRSPYLVEMKSQWVRVLLPSVGRDKRYQKIKEVKDEIIKQNTNSPGVEKRKVTLAEFCKYYALPIDETSFLLNNRFHERIEIQDGPHKNN